MSINIQAIKKAKGIRDEIVHTYKTNYSKNEILKELSRFELKGNVIDQGWFEYLVNESNKVQPNAIFILSEIIYWYRPQLIFDEFTGNIKALKAKFQGDMPQISYEQLAEKFGLTERQVKDACKFLEEKKLIVLDFRTIKLKSGRKINNVLYIGLNVNELRKISILMNDSLEVIEDIKDNIEDETSKLATIVDNTDVQDPITKKRNRVSQKNVIGYYEKKEQAITKKRNTNTKNINTENLITKSINTNNQLIEAGDEENKSENNRLIGLDKQIKEKGFISYEDLIYDLRLDKQFYDYPYNDWIEAIKKAIYEMYYFDDTRIRGRNVSRFDTISKLQGLNYDIIISTIDKIIESSKKQEIRYPAAFIKTILFNEIEEFSAKNQAMVNYNEYFSEGTDIDKINRLTRFHNFEHRSDNYSEEELEDIVRRKRESFRSKEKLEFKNSGRVKEC